jgi:hypothetical protein
MSDNVGSNNLVIKVFCKKLKLKNLIARRLKCLKYIINLAAKAFLFNKEEGGFDFKISKLKIIKFAERQALKLLVFWRKKGFIGKLHNLINWIRNSS